MKLLACAVLTFFAISANADNEEIDWSRVVPRTEIPGFWDERPMFKSLFASGKLNRNGRIVGGAVVNPHTHPYQAGLLMAFSGGTGLCGGSVINARTILTAAHCPIGSTSTQVILGAHQLTAVEPNQQRRTVPASGYRIHESYIATTLTNDIAILILPTAVTLNSFVVRTVLPTAFVNDLFVGDQATISGWGRISDSSSATSSHLRSITQPVVTNEVCRATYGVIIRDSTICIATTGGRSACNGDSGGPLTVRRSGQVVQVGIASFVAAAGCEAGFPGGFARVTSFLNWINTNTQN
jgi:chymotrypsin